MPDRAPPPRWSPWNYYYSPVNPCGSHSPPLAALIARVSETDVLLTMGWRLAHLPNTRGLSSSGAENRHKARGAGSLVATNPGLMGCRRLVLIAPALGPSFRIKPSRNL
jgi:hypothetical protein